MSEQHVDHGIAPSRVWGCVISFVGFMIGGVGIVWHFSIPLIVIAAVLQVVAGVVKLSLDAAGYGHADPWTEMKAKARAERATVQS